MYVYLPIAEMPVNVLLVLFMSAAVGFVSGLVGVGGGFLMNPFLLFMGVPPTVVVGTGVSLVTASSVSGALAYARRRMLDLRMAGLLILGGIVGGAYGVQLLDLLRERGGVDVVISLTYVVVLVLIGGLMLWESVRAIRIKAKGVTPSRRRERAIVSKLPLRIRFPQSGLYISVLPPVLIGAMAGVLGAMMGVGGGFLLVPAMIYLLRMPARVVVGTSLLFVLVTGAQLTMQQAVINKSVDLVLGALLISGAVVGAQIGAHAGNRISPERLRATLGALIFLTGLALLVGVLLPPSERFTLVAS